MERSARDLARMDLELILYLVRSKTRPTSNASFTNRECEPLFPMHPYRCRRRASEDSNHYGEDKIPPNALCSIRTVDHGFPKTKYDARANLKLTSKIERVPRLLSAKKDSWTVDELHCPTHDEKRPYVQRSTAKGVGWRFFVTENIGTSAGKGCIVNIETSFLNTCNETCEMNVSTVCAKSQNPSQSAPELSAHDQRKPSDPTDPTPCLPPSCGGVEWS